ncbi:hypothetical protein A5819_001587 [Enterococcus sp. 7E2_DIV0204]|uniref:hypothetical protein n=1 Tax=unclassified Enterococcus TaxID=2608891 RepID=UPI000A33E213|nr:MULTISPECIES: hypothetical protein [unclassified Enterococcus]OTN89095.1 hypothetical protein A5819_001587 [Enterococcus sp. 7E2_DIV0204]OTP46754.1 hypothetical protein A5884_003765 [Enterococcus sp. 7D2_DIV0200]
MNNIILHSSKQFSFTSKELKGKLEKKRERHQTATTYSNTEASLLWIIRGGIDYFDKLNNDFLGAGNASGIPNIEADHFANNIYRLINAIDYFGELWKLKIEKTDELKLLLDIRTLIVHSGQQLTKLESLELEGYKDSQLGRIFSHKEHDPFHFFNEFSNMDYCIQTWNDKHDKTKKYNASKVDHHIENESYCDVEIYLKTADVRDVILCHVEKFLECEGELRINAESKELPDIKSKVINEEADSIDFDKIADLVSKNLRGGYIKENGMEHWGGFGLKRLYEYSQRRLDISDEVRGIIKGKINIRMSKYWDDYQNKDLTDDELSDLDIRTLFSEFTPKIEMDGGKLFYRIAPFFNTKNQHDATDIDYLAQFINEVEKALGKKLLLEQSVDSLVCEYFAQSIQVKIDS